MSDFIFRDATMADIPFLVETIIEAEKSGTDKLSYSTVFGLTEDEVRKYLADMLSEEVDGCELSVSSFVVAETEGNIAAALSAWIEGIEGLPSAVLKGNLLNYTLPAHCIEKAITLNDMIREIHIEYSPDTIQIGAGYVASAYRGNRLLGLLTEAILERLIKIKPGVPEACAQIFSCNTPSLKTYEKAGFTVFSNKESANTEITKYLPSNKKFLLKKDLKPA